MCGKKRKAKKENRVFKEELRKRCIHSPALNLTMRSCCISLTNVLLDQCPYLEITPFMTGFKALVTGKLCNLFHYDGSLNV